MKQIQIRGGAMAIVDDEDFARLSAIKWSLCGSTKKYAGSRSGTMHRLVIGAQPGQVVDHVNGDTLDNRRANLRICTQSQNLANRINRTSASGFKGVKRHSGGWSARVGLKSGEKYLGIYASAEDAAVAYDNELRRLFGEFAKTNFADARPTPPRLLEQRPAECPCGKTFEVSPIGRPRKFCSRECLSRFRIRKPRSAA